MVHPYSKNKKGVYFFYGNNKKEKKIQIKLEQV